MKTMLAVVLDLLLSPFALLAAALLRWIRSRGFRRFRRCTGACRMVGLLPITDHYYEPYYDPHGVDKQAFEQLRSLPGIDLNEAGQLEFLSCLRHGNELPRQQKNRPPSAVNSYSYSSITFGPGEADYYYCVVRAHKPRRIVEIGSGSSTLVALQAIEANRRDDPGYTCAMTCPL